MERKTTPRGPCRSAEYSRTSVSGKEPEYLRGQAEPAHPVHPEGHKPDLRDPVPYVRRCP